MTDINTPNIFITTNYNHIKNFFLAGNNLSLADLPRTKDTFLICGNQNKYLTHFELSYGFSNPTQQELILKFLDFDGKFESTFFNRNPLKENFLNQYHNAIKSDTQFSNDTSKAMMDFITVGSKGIEKIYCTFGFGNNLNDWSNPTVFTLFDIKYDIGEKGIRAYTYIFSPSPGVLFRPRLFYNTNEPNYNPEFTFAESITDVTVQESDKYNNDLENNYFLIVKNLLKKYVSKLTNTNEDNIIVLLPDLNKAIAEKYPNYHGFPAFMPKGVSKINSDLLRDLFGINFTSNIDIIKDLLVSTRNQKVDPNTVPLPPTDAVNEAATRIVPEYFYRMSSRYAGNKNDSVLAPFPNWYAPINKISEGIKTLFGTVDNLVVLEENDTKILNFWSKNENLYSEGEPWLIKDPNERCIVVGPELFIYEYLYRLGNLSGNSKLKVSSSKYENYLPNEILFNEINDESYTIRYFNAINKRKNSSSFSEKINLDELSIDNLTRESYQQNISNNELLKLQDIPIFTNNLKNSNILSMNVNLGQTYLSQLRLAAGEDFERFVLGKFIEGVSNIKYENIDSKAILERFKLRYKSSENIKFKFNIINEMLKDSLSKIDPRTFDPKSFFDFTVGNPTKPSTPDMSDTAIEEIGVATNSLTQPLVDAWNADVNILKIDDPNHIARAAWKTLTNLLDIEGNRQGIEQRSKARDLVQEEKLKKYNEQLSASKEREKILKPYENLIKNFSEVLIENKENVDFATLLLTNNIVEEVAASRLEVLPENIDPVEKSRAYKFAAYLLAINELNLDNGITITPRISGLPQKVLAGEIFNHIAKQQIKVSLKTLPFFHLSNFRTIQFKPCFLFSKRNNIHYSQSNKNNLAAEEQFEFFSGNYNITAFRHTITTRECYSEFLLQKTTTAAQLT